MNPAAAILTFCWWSSWLNLHFAMYSLLIAQFDSIHCLWQDSPLIMCPGTAEKHQLPHIFFLRLWRQGMSSRVTHTVTSWHPVMFADTLAWQWRLSGLPVYCWRSDVWPLGLAAASDGQGESVKPPLLAAAPLLCQKEPRVLTTDANTADPKRGVSGRLAKRSRSPDLFINIHFYIHHIHHPFYIKNEKLIWPNVLTTPLPFQARRSYMDHRWTAGTCPDLLARLD